MSISTSPLSPRFHSFVYGYIHMCIENQKKCSRTKFEHSDACLVRIWSVTTRTRAGLSYVLLLNYRLHIVNWCNINISH